MSWRTTQLGKNLCDQDRIILDLFAGQKVNYVGNDHEFKQIINHCDQSTNLVLIVNRPAWLSDIVETCHKHLAQEVSNFYISINRYQILGNDTNRTFEKSNHHGNNIINFVTALLNQQGFVVTRSGHYDHDAGRYFNFVQPLTWVYGNKITNTSH
jgi:hypothetical protein